MSSEQNDTKIIWFGSVVLILEPFLETHSFTNFVKSAWAIYGRCSSPQVLFVLLARINGLPGNNVWKSERPLSPSEMSREWRERSTMTMFWEMTIESKLLNQFQWSWHHSFQKTMFYLIKSKYAIYFFFKSSIPLCFDTRYMPILILFVDVSLYSGDITKSSYNKKIFAGPSF